MTVAKVRMTVDATPRPSVEIVFGVSGVDTRVSINGQDITSCLSGVRVECLAGTLTQAVLIVRKGHARATLQAAIEDVRIEDAE